MIRVELQPMLAERALDLSTNLPEKAGDFRLARYRMTQGKQAGCELILVDFGGGRIAVCPTRGMSIWKAELDSVPCQWDSPVRGPVHPCFVPLDDPSGIGWLDGFDELLTRCGLRSFGAPDFDLSGRLRFPLHGRIGNTPAENLQIELDAQASTLVISAEVFETRFLVGNLRLRVEYRFQYDQSKILISDSLTNLSSQSADYQLLYHINFGQPLLDNHSQLLLPASQIVARDARAAEGLKTWHLYSAPTSGFTEQVYFSQPIADSRGWASAVLLSPNEDLAARVSFNTDALPCFTQWKNTADLMDGYVTGLEPGTGFPNPHSFEQQQGRVSNLLPGETREFQLAIEGSCRGDIISEWVSDIKACQGDHPAALLDTHPHLCP